MIDNIFDVYIPAIVSGMMLISLGIRFFQLKNTGQHQHKQYNAPLKIRIGLLCLCILLILTQNFISILDTNFYLYGQDYTQIFIFLVIVYSTQVGTILFEYNKNVPTMIAHKIFWIVCLICNIVQAIYNLIDSKGNRFDILGNVILYSIIVNQIVLNVYSFLIRKQDKIEFESVTGFGVTVPIIEENRQNTIPVQNSFIGLLSSSQSQFKIVIHFSKTWKIIQQKDGQIDAIITLKIFLQNPNQHYQLKKSITDFVELEKQLLKEDKSHQEIYKLPDEFFRQSNDTHQVFNEKLAIIKIYMRRIISKIEYFNQPLYDFLQFDDATKNCIIREMRNKSNSVDQSI